MVDSRIMADEQEVTFDESAATEPEIEPDEGSDEESVKEPDENTAWEGEYGQAGCPIWMDEFGNLGCGRKLHVAPDGVDEVPVCLMHSKDPNKQSGSLFQAFGQEFERILVNAGENEAHCEGFVFPEIEFSGRTFQAICLLSNATFTQDADFYEATFLKNVDFNDATFEEDADFSDASFTQNAGFHNATFGQEAHFGSATFTQDADFNHAIFSKEADFSFATFTQAAHFVGTEFHGTADYHCSRFLDRAEFLHTEFDPRIAGRPSAMFDGINFSKPSEIKFDDVDLSRALFHNCDVSQVWFTASVQWAEREGNRGLAVFDETIPIEHDLAGEQVRDGPRDYCRYCAAEQIYHQLKKNYDSRLDYGTADEFHFSEMEMRRLAGPTNGPFLGLRRWLYPRLSLVALYRYASDYGSSYTKPALWLLPIAFLFMFLFPVFGIELKHQGTAQDSGIQTETGTYLSIWNVQKTWGENLSAEASLVGNCAYNTLDAATFQKSAKYPPAYPWGRLLAIFETLLTSTLFALFLLAIRRQFRR